ncbi:MAG: hypothetical protein AAF293_07480 [Pseudomonadota bacterium]
MMRFLRRVLLASAVFVCLLIVGGVALLYLMPRTQVLSLMTDDLEGAGGFRFETSGTIETVLWPIPGWRLGEIEVTETAAAETAPPLIFAEQAILTIAPQRLLTGSLSVGALWLENAVITVTVTDQGINLPAIPTRRPSLSFLRVRNASLILKGVGDRMDEELELDHAALDYGGRAHPMRIDLMGHWRDRSIEVTAKLMSPDRLARGDWTYVDADISVANDTASFHGRLMPIDLLEAPEVEGTLTAEIEDPADLVSWLSAEPHNPKLGHLKNLDLEARVETLNERLLTRTRWVGSIREIPVTLDLTLSGEKGWRETDDLSLEAVSRAGGLFSAHLNGRVLQGLAITGDMNVSVLDLARIFDSGLLPRAYAITSARRGSLRARLSASQDGVSVADATLQLDNDSFEGGAALDLRPERPMLSVRSELSELPVAEFVDAWIEENALLNRALAEAESDFVIEVSAARSAFRDFETGRTIVEIERSTNATIGDIERLDVFGGTIAGTVRDMTDTNTVEIELTGAEIDAQELLSHAGMRGLIGTMGGQVQITVPKTVDGLDWSNAVGFGSASVTRGELANQSSTSTIELGETQAIGFALGEAEFSIANGRIGADRVDLSGVSDGRVAAGRLVTRDGVLTFQGFGEAGAEAAVSTRVGPDGVVPQGGDGDLSETASAQILAATNQAIPGTVVEDLGTRAGAVEGEGTGFGSGDGDLALSETTERELVDVLPEAPAEAPLPTRATR